MKCILSRKILLLACALTLASVAESSGIPQKPSGSRLPVAAQIQQPARNPGATASPSIAQPTVTRNGQEVIVRISATGVLVSRAMRLGNPDRLVLDFPGAHLSVSHWPNLGAVPPVRGIRAGQFKPDVARVVIEIEWAVPYRVKAEENSITVEFEAPASALVSSPVLAVTPMDQAQGLPNTRAEGTNVPALKPVVETRATPRPDFSTQRATALAGHEPPENKDAPFQNSFASGMLTFRAQNQALSSVLKQIGGQTGVTIYLAEGLGKDQLSVEFRRYRLDEALRQMLKDYDVLFLYRPEGDGQGPALQAVWIYPAGHAQAPRALPEITTTTAKEATAMQPVLISSPHTEAMTGPPKNDSVAEALKALDDPRDDVREQALSLALIARAQIPQETLINLALADASAKIRLRALKALPLNPDLRWVAERATGDWDESVSQAAREVLGALDMRARAESWAAHAQTPSQ